MNASTYALSLTPYLVLGPFQERGFSNTMDKILLNNIYWSSQQPGAS
jgi:hypothetical protein